LKTPIVSICIPSYNNPRGLRRALKSISVQSMGDYEVIVTDDSSDNMVEEIVAEFSSVFSIIYFRNNPRKGTPENWNEAIRHAHGSYIKVLHHDDWFSFPESLEEFVSMMDRHPDADFGFSASRAFGDNLNLKFIHYPNLHLLSRIRKNPKALFPNNTIGAPSATIFRSGVTQRFDSQIKWVVDLDFYIRVLERNPEFVYTKKPLISINSGDSDSQVTASCIRDNDVQIFEWLYLYQKLNPGLFPVYKHAAFIWHLLLSNGVKSKEHLIRAGLKKPLRWEIILYILMIRMLK